MEVSTRERRAASFLRSYRLTVEKISEAAVKTPDFRAATSDGFVFFAEVKAIEGPGDGEGYLWSALYNRLTKDITNSVKQFDSINPQRLLPNVLIVLGEDFRIHGKSVLDFFRGEITIDGEQIADLGRYRRGKARDLLSLIDLYIVLDVGDTPTFFFTGTNRLHLKRLTSIFRVENTAVL